MNVSALLGLINSGAGLLTGKSGKKSRDAWQTAAETYGLLLKPSAFWSGPKLSGPLSGNTLTVDIKDRNTASAATRFRLGVPPLNLGLRLRKKGFWNSLGPRILTGDQLFDSQVVVSSHDPSAAREFLTPERRMAIQSFLISFKGAVVTDDEIQFKTRGEIKKPDEMLGAIDALQRVASVLAEEPSPASGIAGEGAAAAAVAAAAAAAAVAPPFGSEREPAPVAHPAPAPEPAPQPAPEAAPEAALEPAQAADLAAATPGDLLAAGDDSPGAEEFCAAVFAPGALSFAANQTFKASYAGRRIFWQGTLESVTPFTFDFDFGSGRGIKAVLTIQPRESAGSRHVEAVIGLPPGIEGLYDRIGQRLAFTGRLLKVDGLAKRVVIADAELRA